MCGKVCKSTIINLGIVGCAYYCAEKLSKRKTIEQAIVLISCGIFLMFYFTCKRNQSIANMLNKIKEQTEKNLNIIKASNEHLIEALQNMIETKKQVKQIKHLISSLFQRCIQLKAVAEYHCVYTDRLAISLK